LFLKPEVTTAAAAERLRASFARAEPFPHVVLDDVLAPPLSELLPKFPDPTWPSWHRYGDAYQRGKLICSDIAVMPDLFAELIEELSRPAFLAFLESVTGIPRLLVDPYLEGGGLHCSGPGGILAPHTDFHLYPRLGIYRRINVLLYLNADWERSWGGCLELYQPEHEDQPVRTVVPRWGTCVIFRTDDHSPHGFSQPIVGDRWRRSIALYYYTATEAGSYSGDTNTYWRRLPVTGAVPRARQRVYETLILGSRGLAFLAHRIDPNLDRRRRRQPPKNPGVEY
jgi:hypothetical protein